MLGAGGFLLVADKAGWRAVWIAVSLEALVLITLTLAASSAPLLVLLAMAGGVAGGWLAEHLGYYFCFGLAAALSIVAAVLVWHHARLEQVVPSSSQGAVHVG